MNAAQAIDALKALAHEHRLAVYRLLVAQGPDGLAAGEIAARIGIGPSSLTFHVQALQRAGLITQRRQSRQLFYAADYPAMNEVVGYLTENCCGQGQGEGKGDCPPVCRPAASKRKRNRQRAA